MKQTFLLSLLKNINLSKSNTAVDARASDTNSKLKQKAGEKANLKSKSITIVHNPTNSTPLNPDPRLCYFQTDSARVYLEYPPGEIPPPTAAAFSKLESLNSTELSPRCVIGAPTITEAKPSHFFRDASTPPLSCPIYTRFVCISDTHARTFPVPPGDVLLHAGDLTNTGSLADFQKTVDWLCSLPHKWKIIIAGNHDMTLDEDWYEMNWTRFHKGIGKQDRSAILHLLTSPRAKAAGLIYLQDETFKFRVRDGGKEWSVYGSPWSPEFCNWAFGYNRGQDAMDLAKRMPKCDILLTHSPPSDILDTTNLGENVGCEALLDRVQEIRPRVNVFGHIHEGRGVEVWGWGGGDKDGNDKATNGDADHRQGVVAKITEDDLTEISNDSDETGQPDESSVASHHQHLDASDVSSTNDAVTASEVISTPPENPQLGSNSTLSLNSNITPQLAFQTLSAHLQTTSSQLPFPEEYTIFVNAASWPSGPRASRARGVPNLGAQGDQSLGSQRGTSVNPGGSGKLQFGGLGFQPVVIDLLDVNVDVDD